MPRFCTQCGQQISDDARFCTNCGHAVADDNAGQVNNISSGTEQKGKSDAQRKGASIRLSAVIILVLLIISVIRFCSSAVGTKNDTSWAVDAACKKVKSVVYKDYGEIPDVSGKLIYKDGEHYIVAVRYEIPDWWDGSRACLVYGYEESNCFVEHVTTDMSYDCDYKARLDELKALWALD